MHRKQRPLFAMILMAFVTVIFVGLCGMGSVFVLSTRLSGQNFSPPWLAAEATPAAPSPPGAILAPDDNGYGGFRGPVDWRGPASALLALSAVLVGAATFFSRRLTRPLTRLTHSARTMSEGDLTVRVGESGIREINDLASAFNTMASSLSEADRQRRQMTADVAHELRTPLAIIRGRLEGMQDGIYSATPEQVGILLNETALLERLIEDLRVLALADTGQLPLYKESVAPAALVHALAASFEEQGRAQGVAIRIAALPSLPDIEADPQRISQVLSNLVSNSLRHTPAGGAVSLNAWASVSALDDQPSVSISVSDTGSGISPADLPHIFDRFYRANRARTRTNGSTGLGLAIARAIIVAHGGTIQVQSTPGQGAQFIVCLPAATPNERVKRET